MRSNTINRQGVLQKLSKETAIQHVQGVRRRGNLREKNTRNKIDDYHSS